MLKRTSNIFRMFKQSGWREVLVRFDQVFRINYFDFSAVKTEKLGLDPKRSNACRGSATDLAYILNKIPLLPDSSIIDVGAGKGRAMIAMAPFPFKKIGGVEISAELADTARRNLSRAFLAGRSNVVTSCASVFEDYHDYNYFYFYNPFPTDVLRDVIGHLDASINKYPRECWLIYNAAPSDALTEIICSKEMFKKDFEYTPPGKRVIFVYHHQPQTANVI